MIICHRYKYIFIKTEKTAGTSVEIALSQHCGPDDVISAISKVDELTRQQVGGRGPQHHLAPFSDYTLADWRKLLLRGRRAKRFYNHMSAEEILRFIDRDTWDRYYKFCFERNPWDRVISLYYWRHKQEPRPDISDFLASEMPLRLKRRGHGLYTLDGQVAVDRVCHFEDLAGELEMVRQQVGIPEPLNMPRTKAGHRKDKRPYQQVLNEEQRQQIADIFADEIALMGYTFDA